MMAHGEDRKARSPAPGSRLKGVGATALKAAGWVLAVPALCVGVLVAGAVPLYLLLPESAPKPVPAAPASIAADAVKQAPAEPSPEAPAVEASLEDAPSSAPAPTAPATAGPAVADDGGLSGDEGEQDIAALSAEPVHLNIVPTPRPATPALRKPEPDAPDLSATLPSSRERVARAVTLRAGPHGRQLGVLPEGTEVAIIRCDGWCEVRSPEGDGWIHSSFLAGKAGARERTPPRVVERSRREEDIRSARREEARREHEEWRDEDPDWMVPDDSMAYTDDPRGPIYYELEPYPDR